MFDKTQKQKAEYILGNSNSKLSGLNSNDLRKLAVAWSYYSGKIEGNTYTYVETEALLVDGIASTKRYEDAKMLKNLHNTFTSVLEDIKQRKLFELNHVTFYSLHARLIDELVDDAEKGQLRSRPVRISGTNYVPPKEKTDIQEALNEVFYSLENYPNPLEQAIYAHCNLARIQPFIDGNKRTARIMESIVLLQNDLIPIYSTKDEDIFSYRNGLTHFYETEDYGQYIDYFLDKNLNRIKEVSPKTDLSWEDFKNNWKHKD